MNRKKQWLAWAKQFTAKAGGKPVAANAIQFVNLDAPAAEPLEILIYGDIGSSWYEDGSVSARFSARDFAVALAGVPAGREIVVRLNSNGGNVWDGWAIHNLLAARRANVVCVVDGIAASIASVIALAGRELRMAEASMIMVHNAAGLCMGNAADMTEMAAALAKHDEVIAGVYARKTGKTLAEVHAKMTAETWFTAADAQSFGLCDGLCEPDEPSNQSSARGVPAAAANNPNHPADPLRSGAIQNAMNRKQLIALLNKLGLKFDDKATDAELTALAESYTPPAPPTAAATTPPPAAAAATAAPTAAPDAKAVVAEVQRQMRITAAVQTCSNELRIPAASVADFTARALADETILATLQAMPPRAVGAEPINLGGEQYDKAKKMTRAAFNAMKSSDRMDFCKTGGSVTDR